ncbi:MAG: TlpA family protein disulfide reductase [Oligoflexales bacterium]|nr:TlpA family protein disulfide reductase [Oligoflexales bacterium]
MKARLPLFLGLLLLGGFTYVLFKGLSMNPNHRPSHLLGKTAPAFSTESLQQARLRKEAVKKPDSSQTSTSLDDFKGTALVLNFWASWCDSCQEEAKELEALWQKYQGDGLRVLGISIFDQKTDALAAAQRLGKSYDLAIDTEGHIAIEYGVTGVPETFFIDRTGIIQHREAGPMDLAFLEKQVQKILGPPAPKR